MIKLIKVGCWLYSGMRRKRDRRRKIVKTRKNFFLFRSRLCLPSSSLYSNKNVYFGIINMCGYNWYHSRKVFRPSLLDTLYSHFTWPFTTHCVFVSHSRWWCLSAPIKINNFYTFSLFSTLLPRISIYVCVRVFVQRLHKKWKWNNNIEISMTSWLDQDEIEFSSKNIFSSFFLSPFFSYCCSILCVSSACMAARLRRDSENRDEGDDTEHREHGKG